MLWATRDVPRRETKSQRAPWPPQEQDQASGNRSEDEEEHDSDGVLPLGNAAGRGEKERGTQPQRLAEQGWAETVKPIGRFRCPWSEKRWSHHVAMMPRQRLGEHRLQSPRDSDRMASRAFHPGSLTDHRRRRSCEPEHDAGKEEVLHAARPRSFSVVDGVRRERSRRRSPAIEAAPMEG
jgi:hypothetical protein